eukprot:gene9010-12152_t
MSKILSESKVIGEEGSIGRCHACGCVGPNPGYDVYSIEDIQRELQTINPLWVISEDNKSISLTFVCKSWTAAINAINIISEIAERSDIQHHPDFHLTSYRNIAISITTHAVNGLTKHDFKLAKEIDQVSNLIELSPKWLKQNPTFIN